MEAGLVVAGLPLIALLALAVARLIALVTSKGRALLGILVIVSLLPILIKWTRLKGGLEAPVRSVLRATGVARNRALPVIVLTVLLWLSSGVIASWRRLIAAWLRPMFRSSSPLVVLHIIHIC